MAREQRLADMIDKTLQSVSQSAAQTIALHAPAQSAPTISSSASPKTESVDRPMLSSPATSADFTAWEEMWDDYSRCQQLSSQDKDTRVTAVRLCLDEDLRRFFLREGIIALPVPPNAPDMIVAVKTFIRRHRNPLLDWMAFYSRKQQPGEQFDSFYTSLKEIRNCCDFVSTQMCSTCHGQTCQSFLTQLTQLSQEVMRDRLVVGMNSKKTRHKLLATPDLTLQKAVEVCRAEEAATHTSSSSHL